MAQRVGSCRVVARQVRAEFGANRGHVFAKVANWPKPVGIIINLADSGAYLLYIGNLARV